MALCTRLMNLTEMQDSLCCMHCLRYMDRGYFTANVDMQAAATPHTTVSPVCWSCTRCPAAWPARRPISATGAYAARKIITLYSRQ